MRYLRNSELLYSLLTSNLVAQPSQLPFGGR
jgi:hypothetical protein